MELAVPAAKSWCQGEGASCPALPTPPSSPPPQTLPTTRASGRARSRRARRSGSSCVQSRTRRTTRACRWACDLELSCCKGAQTEGWEALAGGHWMFRAFRAGEGCKTQFEGGRVLRSETVPFARPNYLARAARRTWSGKRPRPGPSGRQKRRSGRSGRRRRQSGRGRRRRRIGTLRGGRAGGRLACCRCALPPPCLERGGRQSGIGSGKAGGMPQLQACQKASL